MITTLIILALSAVFFAMGKVRSDLVALCALVALLLTGILTPQEALSGFSNSVVIMMVGLFVVGGAIVQTGLAKKASGKLMTLAGDNELGLFLLLMVVTAVIGAFVSNTGTVALMMPIVVSLAQKAKIRASRLLMALSASWWASSCCCLSASASLTAARITTETIVRHAASHWTTSWKNIVLRTISLSSQSEQIRLPTERPLPNWTFTTVTD